MVHLSDTVGHAVAGGAVFRFNLWLFGRRSLQRARLSQGEYILRRGRIGGVLGLIVATVAAAFGLLLLVTGEPRPANQVVQIIVLCSLIAFVGCLYVVASFAAKYRLNEEGIEYQVLGRRRKMRWSDIERIESSILPYEIMIRSRDRSIVLSFLVVGSGTMAELLLLRVSASTLAANPRTHAELRRIRDGLAAMPVG